MIILIIVIIVSCILVNNSYKKESLGDKLCKIEHEKLEERNKD